MGGLCVLDDANIYKICYEKKQAYYSDDFKDRRKHSRSKRNSHTTAKSFEKWRV